VRVSDSLYRLLLDDGASWAITASGLAEAQTKAARYVPFAHVRIEVSVDGAPWRLADAGCATCGSADAMRGLGGACDVSCGGTE
jgi:hypothetical protein